MYFYEDDNQTLVPRLPYVANFGGVPSVTTILPAIGATNILQRLLFKPNPSEYPFDSQEIELSVEDGAGTPESELQFYWMKQMSGVSDDLRLKGWTWDKDSNGNGVIRRRKYYGGQFTVSQLQWTFKLTRAKIVAVQVLLPPCFVLVSVLISFIMPITASITRIGIVGSALISEVSLHSGFKNANGTAGTLGLIDYFFMLTYIMLVLSLAANVLVMILLRKNEKSPLAIYLESRAKYFVWMVCPGLYTFIFFRGKDVWIAVICLVAPLTLYAIVDALVPRLRALRRKYVVTSQKKKEEATFEDEVEAKMQEGEAAGDASFDTKMAAFNAEVAKKQQRRTLENSDSLSANLYDTDSE